MSALTWRGAAFRKLLIKLSVTQQITHLFKKGKRLPKKLKCVSNLIAIIKLNNRCKWKDRKFKINSTNLH